jgi:hypothetical protein
MSLIFVLSNFQHLVIFINTVIFGFMQGAVDGGLDIPHSVKRFPGTNYFVKYSFSMNYS